MAKPSTDSVFNAKFASFVESYFTRYAQDFLEEGGINAKVVSIGGRYNKDRMVIELGILRPSASKEAVSDMITDMQMDVNTYPVKKVLNLAEKVAKQSGLPKEKAFTLVKNWYVNTDNIYKILEKSVRIGSLLRGDKSTYRVLGFNLRRDLVVLWSYAKRTVVQTTLTNVSMLGETDDI